MANLIVYDIVVTGHYGDDSYDFAGLARATGMEQNEQPISWNVTVGSDDSAALINAAIRDAAVAAAADRGYIVAGPDRKIAIMSAAGL
jgi:hypothetical protein